MRNEVSLNWALRFAAPTLALSLLLGVQARAAAIAIDWITIGNEGNFGGPETFGRSFGAVSYEYRIGKYEVTNSQYVQFLNSKAASDPYQLYNSNMGSNLNGGIARDGVDGSYTYSVKPGYGNLPVVYVSSYDAARFINWMNNGEGNADTENGSYTLLRGTSPPNPANVNALISRNAGATIALPSEDEWYKAAYYDPNKLGSGQPDYWTYATKSDILPSSGPPATHPANAGNYFSPTTGYALTGDTTTGPVPNGVLFLTEVGAYTQSASAYGTFDQLGLTWEWNEGYFEMAGSTAAARGTMGGSFTTPQGASQSPQSYLGYSASRSTVQNVETGFRIVNLIVPCPGDFDSDGDVDGADFVIWQTNFPAPNGHSLATGDTDADGDVDGADFVVWQTNFPYTPVGFNSVPEPNALFLCFIASSALLLIRYSRATINDGSF
jgi:formylglycine-generating enzyme